MRLATADGKPAAGEAWKDAELTSYFSTPVPVGADHFYVVAARVNFLNIDASEADLQLRRGRRAEKTLWTKKKVGKFHAALVRTGDAKLLMLEDGGDLVLIDPSPKEYKELARAKVCGPTWAHPALVGGKLYLRDEKEVICVRLGE